jgi:hypothetical protein
MGILIFKGHIAKSYGVKGLIRFMKSEVLIRLFLRLNAFDPQLTAKHDTLSWYVYDDINVLIILHEIRQYRLTPATAKHSDRASGMEQQEVALNPLKTRRGGWFTIAISGRPMSYRKPGQLHLLDEEVGKWR